MIDQMDTVPASFHDPSRAVYDWRDVEAALIEARVLWLRWTHQGRNPFATDGPWALAQGEAGDYAWDAPLRPLPLTRDEVARVQAVGAWLLLVPDDAARRMIVTVIDHYAATGRVDWVIIMRRMGVTRGRDGLRMRYARAMQALARVMRRGGVQL